MNKKVFVIYTWGNFDMAYPIAICTNKIVAEKLIKKDARKFGKKDYWIKEVKLDTLINDYWIK
jgi:hypothetical protein